MTVILDTNGTPIQVGARVIDPLFVPVDVSGALRQPTYGIVTELTDPDGDVNSYGRQVPVGPYVVVRYDDGTTERWTASWNATGPWDDDRDDYTCDDVEVAR